MHFYKKIIVLRHGELDNPKDLAYNRDSVMRPEDIIHLSQKGREKLRKVGETIKKSDLNPVLFWVSPETRAIESAEELNKSLNLSYVVKPELDEVYTPGPYRKGITMTEWETLENHYDQKVWIGYNHETPENVVVRMTKTFWQMADKLQAGQSGILLSHGDPTCWLLNKIILNQVPEYHQAQKNFFLNKGQAIVIELDQQNKIVKYAFL